MVVSNRRMQCAARSSFATSTEQDPSSPRLRRDRVYILPDQAVPARTARQQKWLPATHEAPPQFRFSQKMRQHQSVKNFHKIKSLRLKKFFPAV